MGVPYHLKTTMLHRVGCHSLKSEQNQLYSPNFVHSVVLGGGLHPLGVPSIIKQMLRITFVYLTVYSVSSYRSIHPDEMKG